MNQYLNQADKVSFKAVSKAISDDAVKAVVDDAAKTDEYNASKAAVNTHNCNTVGNDKLYFDTCASKKKGLCVGGFKTFKELECSGVEKGKTYWDSCARKN